MQTMYRVWVADFSQRPQCLSSLSTTHTENYWIFVRTPCEGAKMVSDYVLKTGGAFKIVKYSTVSNLMIYFGENGEVS